jgi:hypothetical protein
MLERRSARSHVTRSSPCTPGRSRSWRFAPGGAAGGDRDDDPGLAAVGTVGIDLARLPSRFASLLITPQFRTEHVLARRLEERGVPVVHGAEVTARPAFTPVEATCA